MLLVLVLVLPLVHSGDIIHFDFFGDPPEIHNRKDDFVKNEIESEFGVFVDKRPKFQTSPKISSGRARINNLLKNYLTKLYEQKFRQPETKFFGDLRNKTKKINKFLSLFQIVQFANSQCQSSGTFGDYLGTCYHETECSAMNGTNLGDCADGYGVCCVFRNTCGTSSDRNCTYFESPGYPDYDPPGPMVLPPSTMPPPITPDPRLPLSGTNRQSDTTMECTINIYKQGDNIQQMRIDFIDLELRGPVDGTCGTERLVISGQNINAVPEICGYNTGQHVYVDVSTLMGPLQLSVLSNTGERKRYKIRICQIANDCSQSNNCLQYYTGVTGMISSFNYDQAAINNRSEPGYFNNLNYAICIRKEAGFCSITYTNVPNGLEYPFQLVNLNDDGVSTVPMGQAGVDIFNCPDDYIVIGGTRLCGDKLNDGSLIEDFTMNAPVTDSSAGPIVIPVRTDGSVTGRGFKLFYTQNRCP
ncbi:uncharacterized protein LOC123008447 [Tribolium madens]|uniref:uncharacterized protein LOC123008447 n=1 Tax=Tribolium madens TaxID=41895 RepID=UPI001CF73405|nr:uncharacterized protein LOC123008447 [Tribolium madens]